MELLYLQSSGRAVDYGDQSDEYSCYLACYSHSTSGLHLMVMRST